MKSNDTSVYVIMYQYIPWYIIHVIIICQYMSDMNMMYNGKY